MTTTPFSANRGLYFCKPSCTHRSGKSHKILAENEMFSDFIFLKTFALTSNLIPREWDGNIPLWDFKAQLVTNIHASQQTGLALHAHRHFFFPHLDCIFSTKLPPPFWQTKGSKVCSDSKALLCKRNSLLIELSFLVPSHEAPTALVAQWITSFSPGWVPWTEDPI